VHQVEEAVLPGAVDVVAPWQRLRPIGGRELGQQARRFWFATTSWRAFGQTASWKRITASGERPSSASASGTSATSMPCVRAATSKPR
jgi:hypothetical protein